MPKLLIDEWHDAGNTRLRLRIYAEARSDVRYGLSSSGAILRVPQGLRKAQIAEHRQRFEAWIATQLAEKTMLRNSLAPKAYHKGQRFVTPFGAYHLDLSEETRSSVSGTVEAGGRLRILHPPMSAGQGVGEGIRTVISRLIAADVLPALCERVDWWNAQHFRVTLGEVRLRYARTRWGSCSHTGHVNFSTRLLLAPLPVVDAVIVHELAHRIEMNHGPAFWAIVRRTMPDYDTQDAWLKAHGHSLDF